MKELSCEIKNLTMAFLQSAINQVGKDLGRVVSNTVFKDSHSIPIRRAASYQKKNKQTSNRVKARKASPIENVQSRFQESIDFKTSHTPKTLISKLGGAFIIIKNKAKNFIDDGYLALNESQQLFKMLTQFNDKVNDVEDILNFTYEDDAKVYDQLERIVEATKEVMNETLEISAQACVVRAMEYEQTSKTNELISFKKYVALHLIWMSNYAKGDPKNVINAVIANILDIVTLTFPLTRTALFVMGLTSYSSFKKEHEETIEGLIALAHQERERAKTYNKFIKENS